jgi:methionyl aminopeptidase
MIPLKSEQEIRIMQQGGRILADIMEQLKKAVRPGITTKELDRLAESLILDKGGKASFKGYESFPASLCVSLNEQIVHGVPSKRVLKQGDIVSLDLGFYYQGFHTDMAITLALGDVNPEKRRMIRVAKKVLKIAIKKVRPGNTIGDIGNTIQRHVESQGFSVVKDLCGHGIGKQLHEDPQILNYGKRKTGEVIQPGMVFCLEPMVAMGKGEIVKDKDGFAYKTKDNSLSVHFEHTIAVTEKGTIILTER